MDRANSHTKSYNIRRSFEHQIRTKSLGDLSIIQHEHACLHEFYLTEVTCRLFWYLERTTNFASLQSITSFLRSAPVHSPSPPPPPPPPLPATTRKSKGIGGYSIFSLRVLLEINDFGIMGTRRLATSFNIYLNLICPNKSWCFA